jgi:hypothetical protein
MASGVILVCSCRRWGIAAATVERAQQAYSIEHLAEFGFRYSRDDDDAGNEL